MSDVAEGCHSFGEDCPTCGTVLCKLAGTELARERRRASMPAPPTAPEPPGPVGPTRIIIADAYTGFTMWRYLLPSRWQARLLFRANECDVVRIPDGSAWRRLPNGSLVPESPANTC